MNTYRQHKTQQLAKYYKNINIHERVLWRNPSTFLVE